MEWMDMSKMMEANPFLPKDGWIQDACDYFLDAGQRSILFLDVLRERGNNYVQHLNEEQPPVLVFKYEIIMDGRTLDRPANYSLAKIIDRRKAHIETKLRSERRGKKFEVSGENPYKRPIVVIDPRAGHGPGIGGSKQDSEIGLALSYGHPVYFILFYTSPMPGQTLADVKNAEIAFLEEVRLRHPEAPKPTVIGNCQGGWAAALLGSDRPDLVGPLVLNGSPLSYWSGVDGKNPMRYLGGLLGGVWMNSFLADLSNGQFDGANLVMNMENLNPSNTIWAKQYHLYANIDTEGQRFLDFEKWWGGFFWMTKAEIHKIVDGLFIGNKLVQGTFELEDGSVFDLKHFNDPVVVFASEGDNITPPQQALNWIPKVYESVEEIKRCQQVVVYIVHPKIGHLGIFVASSIAKKEQKEIIGSVEMIEYLMPGLYEMVIDRGPSKEWMNDYAVRFEERTMEDIFALDDGLADEDAFAHVAVLSEINDKFYNAFVSPFVQAMSSEKLRQTLRLAHPLRTQRYGISDLNLFLVPVKTLAPYMRESRKPVKDGNLFLEFERYVSTFIEDSLDTYRDFRDMLQEGMFKAVYGNPMMRYLFPDRNAVFTTSEMRARAKAEHDLLLQEDREKWRSRLEKGGYREGLVRMLIAVAASDGAIDESEMKQAEKTLTGRRRLQGTSVPELKSIVKEQGRILQSDFDGALEALPRLLTRKADRVKAYSFAEEMALADRKLEREEVEILERMKAILNI